MEETSKFNSEFMFMGRKKRVRKKERIPDAQSLAARFQTRVMTPLMICLSSSIFKIRNKETKVTKDKRKSLPVLKGRSCNIKLLVDCLIKAFDGIEVKGEK